MHTVSFRLFSRVMHPFSTSHSLSGAAYRTFTSLIMGITLVAGFLVPGVGAAEATENKNPVVGSFGMGGSIMGGIDERTGKFGVQFPVISLPGLGDEGLDLGISYAQDSVGEDRFGLGSHWRWGIPFVEPDGGVRVFSASGGVFEADASVASGLARYELGDLFFSQEPGVLPAKTGASDEIPYAYSLTYEGGRVDYFNTFGDVVARVGLLGHRQIYEWESGSHRLVGCSDDVGNHVKLAWNETGVRVESPPRSDNIAPVNVLGIESGKLVSVTNPLGKAMNFRYQDAGLLSQLISEDGLVTEVSYHNSAENVTVGRVKIRDGNTELSVREWNAVGEHTAYGAPIYTSEGQLWGSGDGAYRYQTELSDGPTRVVSEYNSLGLMVSRDIVVSGGTGDVTAQRQEFTYPGTASGGVPQPGVLPQQYQKPVNSTVISSDDKGRSRRVSQHTEFDATGHLVKEVSEDGTVTETVYDKQVPDGLRVPVGLVVEKTTTGVEGTMSKTVNTLTDDRKTIQATETFVDQGEGMVSTSRTEFVVEPDGFISEEKTTATAREGGQGPQTVVSRFSRTVNPQTVTVSQTIAADTPAQSTTSKVFDTSTGLVVAEIDAIGRRSSSSYDAVGRVVETVDSQGLRTVTEHGDRLTRVTDPRGVTTSTYVDGLGQTIKVTNNLQPNDKGEVQPVPGFERTVEKRAYEKNSSQVTVTDERGRKSVSVSDVFGRPVKVSGPNDVTQVTEYDDVSNTIRSGKVPTSNSGLSNAVRVTETRMDDANRVTNETGTRSDGVRVPEKSTTYDGLGRVMEEKASDISTRLALNADGTPKSTQLSPVNSQAPADETIVADREFDMFGTSTKKTLSQHGESRDGVARVFDAAGRLLSETNQAGSTTYFTYSLDGLVTESQNASTGVTKHNRYDAVTRALTETQTTSRDGSVSTTGFEYDPLTAAMTAVFDPANPEETRIRYTYDVFGNVTRISYPDGKTIHNAFDEFGRATRTVDIVGNVTTFEYNQLGLLTHATQTLPDGGLLSTVEYSYDRFGRIIKLARDNGVTTKYTFTSADQIKTETTKRGDVVMGDAAYEYDPHGNVVKKVDTRPQDTDCNTLVTNTTTYSYNAYDQLIASAVFTGDKPVGEPFTHSVYEIGVSGNVAKETTTHNGETVVREFERNSLGHTTAITTNGVRTEQTYDSAGNITQAADGTTYTYTVHNQPLTETRPDATTITSTYWADGKRRTSTTATGDIIDVAGMYWDGTTLINDSHHTSRLLSDISAGNTSSGSNSAGDNPAVRGSIEAADESWSTASYLLGVFRHARTLTNDTGSVGAVAGGTDYYVTDRHGSVTATIDPAGEFTAQYAYTDYGTTATEHPDEKTGAFRNPFRYAGEYTTVTDTQYLGKRTYDPKMMAFTTQDDADQFNLYSYANSNPITFVDPSGQTSVLDIINGITVAVSVIAAGFAIETLFSRIASMTWSMIGVSVVGLGTEFASGATALLNITEQHTGLTIFGDEAKEIVSWTTLATSIVAGIGIVGMWKKSITRESDQAAAVAEKVEPTDAARRAIKLKKLVNDVEEAIDKAHSTAINDFLDDARFEHLPKAKRNTTVGWTEENFIVDKPKRGVHIRTNLSKKEITEAIKRANTLKKAKEEAKNRSRPRASNKALVNGFYNQAYSTTYKEAHSVIQQKWWEEGDYVYNSPFQAWETRNNLRSAYNQIVRESLTKAQ